MAAESTGGHDGVQVVDVPGVGHVTGLPAIDEDPDSSGDESDARGGPSPSFKSDAWSFSHSADRDIGECPYAPPVALFVCR